MIKDVHALLSRGGGVRGYPLTLFDLIGGITPPPPLCVRVGGTPSWFQQYNPAFRVELMTELVYRLRPEGGGG